MGTRNLTIVKCDKEVKVAQYCQWDGYPTGQGTDIAKFLQDKLNMRKLKNRVRKLRWLSDEEVDAKWAEVGATGSMVNMKQSEDFKKKFPYLSRDCGGADVLEIIQDGVYKLDVFNSKTFKTTYKTLKNIKVDGLVDASDFLNDGLFCEYAYEIDLDKKTVTVYVGGSKHSTIKFKDFTIAAMKEMEKQLEAA